MEYAPEQEKVIDDAEDEGWVDTHHFAEKSTVEDKVSEMKLDDEENDAPKDDSDEEAVDMEAFVESGMLEDAATIDPSVKKSAKSGGEIVSTRTYDLNITYDKYYQTPRYVHKSMEPFYFVEYILCITYVPILGCGCLAMMNQESL